MCKAKCQLDWTAMVTGKRLVGRIAVDLQEARKACQLWGNLGGAASVGEYVGHRPAAPDLPGRS
jgi:hypothetical protein